MRIHIENKTKIILDLTPAEAVVLADYLDQAKTTKPQRGTLNPVKLAQQFRLFSSWLIDGVRHDVAPPPPPPERVYDQ